MISTHWIWWLFSKSQQHISRSRTADQAPLGHYNAIVMETTNSSAVPDSQPHHHHPPSKNPAHSVFVNLQWKCALCVVFGSIFSRSLNELIFEVPTPEYIWPFGRASRIAHAYRTPNSKQSIWICMHLAFALVWSNTIVVRCPLHPLAYLHINCLFYGPFFSFGRSVVVFVLFEVLWHSHTHTTLATHVIASLQFNCIHENNLRSELIVR